MILSTNDGTEFDVFTFGPDEAEFGVLIVHDWWGVLQYNKDWAQRLAETLGYKTMVVDLYDGERARNAEEAGEIMRSLDQELADAKLLTAMESLKGDGRRLATLGWSLGGRQAMQAALIDPDLVKAAVLIYCRMLSDTDQLVDLNADVMAVYAERERTWPAKMEKFDEAMATVGKNVTTYTYDAEHGFINPGSERYNAEYAEQVWEQTVTFLKQHLG